MDSGCRPSGFEWEPRRYSLGPRRSLRCKRSSLHSEKGPALTSSAAVIELSITESDSYYSSHELRSGLEDAGSQAAIRRGERLFRERLRGLRSARGSHADGSRTNHGVLAIAGRRPQDAPLARAGSSVACSSRRNVRVGGPP